MSDTVLRAFLFTDIADATALKQRVGDTVGAQAIGRHDRLFRVLLTEHHGEEHENPGDGFFASFPRPSDAVRCALEFQKRLATDEACRKLRIRCSVHVGESVRVTDDDGARPKLLGLAVDAAARVMKLALPGQLLVTRHAFDSVRQQLLETPDRTPVHWLAHGPYQFRGVDSPIEVFEAALEGTSPASPPPDGPDARRVVASGEDETLGWRPAVGLSIPGRDSWELERRIGEGSFGEAWLARHRETRYRRIFKFCFHAERLRSLKRELKLFRILREVLGERPDIARLYEVQLSQPPYFLEMEYSDGGNLAEWAESQGGLPAIPLETRLDWFLQVSEALAAAHSVGVIHRDVKPANILVRQERDGRAQLQLSDFGIGEVVDSSRVQRLDLTISIIAPVHIEQAGYHGLADTQRYLAPELLAGDPATQRTDVYALGVLLFQLIVGDFRRPIAHGWEGAIDDPVLREDIAACVAGDPNLRPASAAEVADRIRRLAARRTEHAVAMRRAKREARRAHGLWGLAVTCAGLLIALAVTLWQWREALHQSDQLRVTIADHQRQTRSAAERADTLAASLEQTSTRLEVALREGAFWRDAIASTSVGSGGRAVLTTAERLVAGLIGDPHAEATVRLAIGRGWLEFSELQRASPQLQAARELAEYSASPSSDLALEAAFSLAELHAGKGDESAAEQTLRGALAACNEETSPDLRARLRNALIDILDKSGRVAEAAAVRLETP